jgi:hypothetical protein
MLELNQWLDELGFTVSVSHDGTWPARAWTGSFAGTCLSRASHSSICTNGSPLRGVLVSTPCSIDQTSPVLRFKRSSQSSRDDPKVMIGEGGFVDAYDAGGLVFIPEA